MKATKFKHTYKCKGQIIIYKKEPTENGQYGFEYFEIKNLILTDR